VLIVVDADDDAIIAPFVKAASQDFPNLSIRSVPPQTPHVHLSSLATDGGTRRLFLLASYMREYQSLGTAG
jgi:hypothetical protein